MSVENIKQKLHHNAAGMQGCYKVAGSQYRSLDYQELAKEHGLQSVISDFRKIVLREWSYKYSEYLQFQPKKW